MLKQFFQPLIAWYLAALKTAGYPVIVLLMTMESSFLPLPSEVIIPPAAHLAWSGDGINFFNFHFAGLSAQVGLVIAGAFGSWLGATLMYWLARLAGRPLVLRYGKFVLFPPEKLGKAERWMSHYGAMGVFIARLLPGARQLVGIPAGIARMDYLKFSIFTLLGSTIWCAVLCYVGVKAGQDEKLMHGELHHVALWLGGAMIFLGALYYFFVHRQMKRMSESDSRKLE
jgi:membrane protein DedA with SNARE-associated domain